MARREKSLPINPTLAAICLSGLATLFYFLLAWAFPVVHWYDAHIRLGLRDQVLLGHWLPLIQILIVLVSKFADNLLVMRALLAVIAGGTLFCVYLFMGKFLSMQAAFIAMALLGTNLMFVALATVPYPEVLFIGLLLLALTRLDGNLSGNRDYLGLIALNLACLTRYEGWLLAAMFVGEVIWRNVRTRAWLPSARTTCLAAVAPLGWLLFGVSTTGNLLDRFRAIIAFEVMTKTENLGSHFLSHLSLDYLVAFTDNYFHLLRWQAGYAIVLLGVFGWLRALRSTGRGVVHWRALLFVVLDWLLLCLWRPWDFTNLRTAFLGEVFLLLYAAYGIQQLVEMALRQFAKLKANVDFNRLQSWTVIPLMFIFALNAIPSTFRFVRETSYEADFSRPAQISTWMKPRLEKTEAILVLTDDVFQPYALATYTGLPYDAILDERFENLQLQTRLALTTSVYIVELYRSRQGLSPGELELLTQMEDQTIPTQLFSVGSNRVWFVSADQIEILTASYLQDE